MKPNIHPQYVPVTLVLSNNEEFVTNSTFTGGRIVLDVDFRNHHAWTGSAMNVNQNASQVAKFNKKFGGIGGLFAKED